MAAELILVRHGNTFGPGDKVVWCGARTDLALTDAGLAQARTLAATLKTARIRPARILTGPLLRTRQHSDIIAGTLDPSLIPIILELLREIDYGQWEGLSTEEITAMGGGAELAAWDAEAKWPEQPGWSPGEDQIRANAQDLLAHVQTFETPDPTLVVTSNGILRFFARCADNPPSTQDLKVRTGHHCHMRFEKGGWRVLNWNLSPETAPHLPA